MEMEAPFDGLLLLSGFAMVSCNVLSCGTQLVGVFFVVVLAGC